MNDRKKDVGATRSTEFRVGAATKVVAQVKGYLYTEYEHYNFYLIWYFIHIKAYHCHSKMDFGSGTSKSYEIFRICWIYGGEAVVKFSALYLDV